MSSIVQPIDMAASLLAWWNANPTFITKNGSDEIEQVDDQSGNGHDLVQSIGTNKPSWFDDVANGMPVIRFATDDFLSVSSWNPSGELTICCARYYNSFSASTQMIASSHKVGTPDGGIVYGVYNASGTQEDFICQSGTGGTWVSGMNFLQIETQTAIEWQVDVIRIASGDSEIFSNDVSIFSDGTAGAIADGNDFNLGQDANAGGSYFNGDIAEFIIFDEALSTYDRRQVQFYLSSKFGITL